MFCLPLKILFSKLALIWAPSATKTSYYITKSFLSLLSLWSSLFLQHLILRLFYRFTVSLMSSKRRDSPFTFFSSSIFIAVFFLPYIFEKASLKCGYAFFVSLIHFLIKKERRIVTPESFLIPLIRMISWPERNR